MREKFRPTIEVHVAGICFNHDRVFVAQRSPARTLFPNVWECGGGSVNPGENFEDALGRQFREEFAICVEPLEVIGTYDIDVPNLEQKKIPGLRYLCQFDGYYGGRRPRLSAEHVRYRWLPVTHLHTLAFIPRLADRIREGYNRYQRII